MSESERNKTKPEKERLPVGGLLVAMATIILGGLASDAVKGERLFSWLPIPERVPTFSINLSVVLVFFLLICLLYKVRYQFQAARSLSEKECAPHRCIILPISNPGPSLPVTFSGSGIGVDTVMLAGRDIREDIDKLTENDSTRSWNWLHMLRAFEPHVKSARRIYLLGSNDTEGKGGTIRKGSYHNLAEAEKLLKNYARKDACIERVGPVGFESFDGLMSRLRDIRKNLKKEGFSDSNIIIDVTGGQKIPSIVGAVATMQSRLTFQYVQTNWPFKVVAYDVEIQNDELL